MAKLTKEKRAKMEKLIYDEFDALDPTGRNTAQKKAFFSEMSDAQFKSYFDGFFEDDKAYIKLGIIDYEIPLKLENIKKGADVLGIPLFEYVYMPHVTMDENKVIHTPEPVPVGYIHVRRPQQTVMHKNGMSTTIDQRSAITGQVTGNDKNGRESDLENTMLVSLGMTNTLKELNAPRADDPVMKQEMLRDIAVNGYTRLSDMTDDISNKVTLNTVNTYFLGMSIQTDLVNKSSLLRTNETKNM